MHRDIQEKQTKHCSKKYREVLTGSLGIKQHECTIPSRPILKAIARNVQLLGCKGLSFCKYMEEIGDMNDSRQNPGNFAIFHQIVHYKSLFLRST